jgi:DNA-binding protein HU-beta
MSKETLINTIMSQQGCTKKAAEDAIKMVTSGIEEAMRNGQEVNLIGFGKFEVKAVAERKARNPQTGEEMTIPAGKAVKFKIGKSLKDTVK